MSTILCVRVRVWVGVIFAFVPAGAFLDLNTMICLDPKEPKTRHEQVLLYIQADLLQVWRLPSADK